MNLRAVLSTRAVAVLAVLLAGWPALRWFFHRLGDGSDEPHGLLALAAALAFAPWRAWREPLSPRRHALLAALLAVHCAAYPFAPPLARALLFVALIAVAAAPPRFAFAWGALLALSLPFVATLQFYLGYPLRALTAWLCTPLLALGGLDVQAAGTTLAWAGERVIVDTPCSGLRMLWTGLLLAAVLACHHRLDTRAALALFRLTGLVVFVANVLRATALFCLETNLWPNPAWAHETAGLILFALAAALVLFIADRRPLASSSPHTPAIPAPPPRVTHWVTRCRSRACYALHAFLFFAALAASAPLWPRASPHALAESATASTTDWPAGAVGDDWSPLPLGEREIRFARDFPGRIGVFSTPDGRTIVLRHVARPTRKLHPAADCLRGLGYDVTPRPVFAQNDGVEWGEVAATRDNESLRVRERILGSDGRAWTDISAWYWSAALGRATGPWLAITELGPLPSSRRLAP